MNHVLMKGLIMNRKHSLLAIVVVMVLIISTAGYSQKPYRIGTTSANFLEIGVGSIGNAMGDAQVANVNDLTSIYWNPAGLGFLERNEAVFSLQPWVVDISHSFVGAGLVLPGIGTLALGLTALGYGDIEVTNLVFQDGTGESYTANEMAVSLSFGRRLVQWFSFGASAKYVNSSIWHMSASTFAVDLGVIVSTEFFSPTGNREDGMRIGMSISNYGGRMRYDGIDLMNPIDISPDEEGHFRDTPGLFRVSSWELPLIFRIGFAINPVVIDNHRITFSADALHPNNNSESVNVGAQYALNVPSFGEFFIRGGYKALFMEDSEYGPTFGGGVTMRMAPTLGMKVDYAYRTMGVLGDVHSYTFSLMF